MDSKPIIAIDIDDVLAANAKSFIDFSNERFGTKLTIDDYHEHWGEMWNVDHDEVEKRSDMYHSSGNIEKCEIIDGAKDVLKELKNRYEFVIITSRLKQIQDITKDWINRCYPNIFSKIIFSGIFDDSIEKDSIHRTKSSIANDIKADFMIDDQLKHVEAAAKLGIKCLLFGNYSWNQSDNLHTNIVRVKNWNEVLNYFNNLK